MKLNKNLTTFLCWTIGLSLIPRQLAMANTLQELANGTPQAFNSTLPPSSFVPLKARKLKNARVLWFNFDLAKSMGIQIPAGGMTPEFEAQILDAFAYIIPDERSDLSAFDHKEVTLYADRYGGDGLGNNLGSGRAATGGSFQRKGIGRTPLVGESVPFDHAHGGASKKESINEAIWGEILHRELPHGGNRVLLVMDTGTYTFWQDGGREPRALIVREDALRPAHFVLAPNSGTQQVKDIERVKESLQYIHKSLPQRSPLPPHTSEKEMFKRGMYSMLENWSEQFAAMFARRMAHSARSASNIELHGKLIDYGTQTTISGFFRGKTLPDAEGFGEELLGHRETLEFLEDSIKKHGPRYLQEAMEPIPHYLTFMKNKFDYYVGLELIELAGFPRHLVRKLEKSKSSKKLTNLLREITALPAEIVHIDKHIPDNVGKYDVRGILLDLSSIEKLETTDFSTILHQFPLEKRKEMVKTFLNYRAEAILLAQQDGVSAKGLVQFVRERTALRTLDTPELYRPNLHAENIRLIDQYDQTHNRSLIWDFIDHKINASTRTYSQLEPYQTVLARRLDAIESSASHVIFDAKAMGYFLLHEAPIVDGQVYFFGQRIDSKIARKGLLRYTTNGWKNIAEVAPVAKNDRLIFQIPIDENSSEIKFAFRSEDGKQWWKAGESDIQLHLIRPQQLNHCWGKVDLILRNL